jgi:hypothetical protein
MNPRDTIQQECGQMNQAQQEDLFIEWSLYEDLTRKAMVNEYQKLRKLRNREDSFLDFLKEKLEIQGYWEMVGLA